MADELEEPACNVEYYKEIHQCDTFYDRVIAVVDKVRDEDHVWSTPQNPYEARAHADHTIEER